MKRTEHDTKFLIQIASDVARHRLSAEIWFAEDLLGEVFHECGDVQVQLYGPPPGATWIFSFAELVAVLERARAHLGPPGPEDESSR